MAYQGRDDEPAYHPLLVKVIRLSQRAALCELLDYDNEQLWIPFSTMEDEGRDLKLGDEEDLMVEEWFLNKNGIEVD